MMESQFTLKHFNMVDLMSAQRVSECGRGKVVIYQDSMEWGWIAILDGSVVARGWGFNSPIESLENLIMDSEEAAEVFSLFI